MMRNVPCQMIVLFMAASGIGTRWRLISDDMAGYKFALKEMMKK
jgi:nitroreductase